MLNTNLRRGVVPYLLAGAAVLVMAAARWLVAPVLGEQLPFTTFLIAVLVAAWFGGLGPAVFATALGAVLGMFLFIPPIYSLELTGRMEAIRVLLFSITGVIAAFLGESHLRAQARAEAAAARFRAMAESSPLGIYITDPSGDCLYTNPAYQQISGLPPKQALGSGWSQAIHPDDRERVFQEWYGAAQRRKPFQSEHRFAHTDGTVVWTRVNAAEISDGNNLVGYVGLVENITEHAAAQEALRQSEERYRAFIEQTTEGVWRFELEQPVSVDLPADEQIDRFYAYAYLAECNDAVARMYGFANAGELIGARLSDMMPRSDPQNLAYLRAFVQSGYRLTDAESHEIDREGRGRYFLNNLIGVVSKGQLLRAWGSQRDVTASRKAEAAIQASEARFRSVFDSGMIGIGFWNGERMTAANDTLLGMLGYTRHELDAGLLGRGRLNPPGYEAVDRRAAEETRIRGSCTPYEKEFLRKDGTKIPVLVGGARLGPDLTDAAFFVLDITERRRAEDRLRQAERIEVVGQLAGGMAHEANNQMSVVLGAASFILARPDLSPAVRQDVGYIRDAAERTASITRQLLAFSRRQILQPRVLDLNAALQHLESILRRTLTEEQTLSLRLAADLAPIRADPAQLDQVVLNLAINARDAMPNGGTLTLETRSEVLTDQYIALRPGVGIAPGRYTALLVSDTGQGMDSETMKHLFEPFFTTKPVGKGSGLGLAMVYGIVKQSGGYIWAYSEPGMGSTLKLYFPAADTPVTDTATPVLEPAADKAGGTVLVVEDDPLVRGMARRALVEAGFQVREAANGQEALKLAAREPRLDAVLTDLAMPVIGGRELARRLQTDQPGLPVIFMSGYTDDEVVRRGLLERGVPFLEKPFSPELLARTLREVVEGAPRQA
ncbi:MAG TPA: PAS domain S-box protein [Gemmatimonadales bacterium]|nr:PAS domain S-box protein [Gemmatimonadales bacterium]